MDNSIEKGKIYVFLTVLGLIITMLVIFIYYFVVNVIYSKNSQNIYNVKIYSKEEENVKWFG